MSNEYVSKVKEGLAKDRFASIQEVIDFLVKEISENVKRSIFAGMYQTEDEVADAVAMHAALATDVFPEKNQFEVFATLIIKIEVESLYSLLNSSVKEVI